LTFSTFQPRRRGYVDAAGARHDGAAGMSSPGRNGLPYNDAAGDISLSSRILRRIIPLTLSSILLLGLASYFVAKQQILGSINREISATARQAADNMAAFFNLRQEDALSLSGAVPLHDYLKYRDYGLKEEAAALRREISQSYALFARHKGVYSRISYCDAQGHEVAAATAAGPAAPRPERFPLPIPPRGETRHTDISPQGQGPGEILYWIGVYDDQRLARGSIVLVCDLRYARRILARFRIGKQGRALLVGAEGRELLFSGAAFASALSGKAAISGTPWSVTLEVKPDEFLAPLRKVGNWTIVFSIFIMVLMFLWVAYLVRLATRPISDMAEGTKKITAGNLDFRFIPPPVRELRVLGDAFNDMAKSLKERKLLLEARIRELSALRDMEGAVLQRQGEDNILRICLKAVAEGLDFDRTGLYWVDPAGQEIVGRYLYAAGDNILSELEFSKRRIPLGAEEILNEVIRTRTSLHVCDPKSDLRLNQAYIQEADTREFLMAPICGKDLVFGVLVADNRRSGRALKATDKDGLTVFANAAGLALENTTLFQRLSESEARYRTVLDNSPEAVLGLSREHWIATWNRGAEAIFGYSEAEIMGKPLNALFPPEAEKAFLQLAAEVMKKGSVRDFLLPGRARGGRLLDLSLSWGGAQPDFLMNKEWTVVIRDVTEARKLERQIIQSEKLSAVGRLIAGIAHELNNPLQGVIGYAQFLAILARLKNSEDVRFVYQSAMRCRKIIENLLLFVRQGGIEKRPVCVRKMVSAALELLDYKLHKAGAVRVVSEVPQSLPSVNGDFQQLQQVLVNLVNNACDAMAGRSGPKEIHIRALAAEDRVRLEVADNGPGIAPEHQARLFEPFFSTKDEGCGTGLGLAICRQIVADHGGTIGLSTGPGEGARFVIDLPAAAAPAKRAAKLPFFSRAPKGKAVLLVDDEPAILSLLSKVLCAEGCRVETASSLAEAVAKAGQKPFDLVVADARLGDGLGISLHEGWANHSPFPVPIFLFITGDALNIALEKAFAARSLPLLYKPVDIGVFRQAVRALLKGAPTRRGS